MDSFHSLKQFVGIYFNSTQWQVVPKLWLVNTNSSITCYWPIKGDVVKLSQQQQTPGKDWKSYPIHRVAESSSKYKIGLDTLLLFNINKNTGKSSFRPFLVDSLYNEYS